MRHPPPPHAQIHLPPLDASCALTLIDVFERAIAAIWRAHGDAMADLQAARGIETPRPHDAVWTSDPDGPLDDCF
jgi:hypothetical protein